VCNQTRQPNARERTGELDGQQNTGLRIVERPARNELRHQRAGERDLDTGQNESGKKQDQQIALAGCDVYGDGVRAHWLSTILQDCSAASNRAFLKCGIRL
jgi:hypothetical protein